MKNLKNIRISLNLTQEELAKQLSIEQNTLSQYEADKFPSFKILKKISEFLKVSIDYLILDEKCFYARDIKFINLALLLDNNKKNESLNHIIKTLNTVLPNKEKTKIDISQDNISENLKNNFHDNLKILRNISNISQQQLSDHLKIDRSVISLYEKKSYPSIEKTIKLSGIFNCSIHALVTGEKLFFDFKDKKFGAIILLADHLLTIEDKNFLIKLMTNLLTQK